MECPRCGKQNTSVYRTENFGSFIRRTRVCDKNTADDPGCGLLFYTEEITTDVKVYNPGALRADTMSIKEYKVKLAKAIEMQNQTGLFE